jgi:small multidrug resistance family-3 protein
LERLTGGASFPGARGAVGYTPGMNLSEFKIPSRYGLVFFLIASLFELSGANLIWKWKDHLERIDLAALGLVALVAYACTQTVQPENFGRTFEAYGGVFVFASVIWGWLGGSNRIDAGDILGALVSILGSVIIVKWPR